MGGRQELRSVTPQSAGVPQDTTVSGREELRALTPRGEPTKRTALGIESHGHPSLFEQTDRIRVIKLLELFGTTPELRWTENDQTDPAGRYRTIVTGDTWKLQRAATALWATQTDLITAVSNLVTIGVPTTVLTGGVGAVTLRRDAGGTYFNIIGAEDANEGGSIVLADRGSGGSAAIYTTSTTGAKLVRALYTGNVAASQLTYSNVTKIDHGSIGTFQYGGFAQFLSPQGFLLQNTADAASNEVLRLSGGNRAAAANNDSAYVSLHLDNSLETQDSFAQIKWIGTDITNNSKDAEISLSVMIANSLTEVLNLSGTGVDTPTGYQVSGTQVVGAQGATVADATDAASVITQLNALLARCRAHGLIAT